MRNPVYHHQVFETDQVSLDLGTRTARLSKYSRESRGLAQGWNFCDRLQDLQRQGRFGISRNGKEQVSIHLAVDQ